MNDYIVRFETIFDGYSKCGEFEVRAENEEKAFNKAKDKGICNIVGVTKK